MSHKKEVVKMLSKTSIQAMYINRVKDLERAKNRIDNYSELAEDNDSYDIFLDSAIVDYERLETELELLRLILDEDVPEVKSV
jgi:hypothetical protein